MAQFTVGATSGFERRAQQGVDGIEFLGPTAAELENQIGEQVLI